MGRRPVRQLQHRPIPRCGGNGTAATATACGTSGAATGVLGEFATRFAGSSDLYGGRGRRPTASINLITVHDGFTLADLVSYDHKHNQANGTGNEGGSDDNRSWNCGAEGPTDNAGVLALRARQQRALLTTLLLSFGVPLLLGGDELGRTQQGNNNPYCLDGPLTWFDWAHVDDDLLAFTRQVIAFRLAHPVFRRKRFLSGVDPGMLRWYTPAGTIITGEQWADPGARSLAIHLEGQDEPDPPPMAPCCSTTTSSSSSTPGGNPSSSCCHRPARARNGWPRSTPTTRPAPRRTAPAAQATVSRPVRDRSSCCADGPRPTTRLTGLRQVPVPSRCPVANCAMPHCLGGGRPRPWRWCTSPSPVSGVAS